MDFYKLGKIDKIVISIVFILGAISSFFGNIVLADTPVEVMVFDFYLTTGGDGGGTFTNYNNSVDHNQTICFYGISGHSYVIDTSSDVIFGYSSSIPELYSSPDYFSYVASNHFEFTASDDGYYYFASSRYAFDYSVYDVTGGFDGVIGNLSHFVSGELIWNNLVSSLPFILVCTTFGLGSVFIHRLIKSGSKGKAKLF